MILSVSELCRLGSPLVGTMRLRRFGVRDRPIGLLFGMCCAANIRREGEGIEMVFLTLIAREWPRRDALNFLLGLILDA